MVLIVLVNDVDEKVNEDDEVDVEDDEVDDEEIVVVEMKIQMEMVFQILKTKIWMVMVS